MPKSPKKSAKLYIASANDLLTGEVVYLARNGEWGEGISDTAVEENQAELERLTEQANAARQVIDQAFIEVTIAAEGTPRPVALREIIRERGPTCRSDLGRQAQGRAA